MYHKKQSAQFETGVPEKTMRRILRLTSLGKPCSANCDSYPQKKHAAQIATAILSRDSRRKLRNHSPKIKSLIPARELDFSKKKYAAQLAIRLFKNNKSNSGSGIRLFLKKYGSRSKKGKILRFELNHNALS